ncbi:MAG TPA: hypothetical protein VEA58_08735, partial [Anaerovoracaceae bacterium]|nr:hypothetical protein [Anaerovoracaceae bacterium]
SQERLDILRDERDQVKQNHDDQIDVMREQLDALKDQRDALKDMPVGELPDVSKNMKEMEAQIDAQIAKLRDMKFDAAGGGLGFEMPGLDLKEGSFLDSVRDAFVEAQRAATEAGAGSVRAFFDGLGAALGAIGQGIWGDLIIDTIWGEGTSERLEQEAWGSGRSIAQYLFDGLMENLTNFGEQVTTALLKFFGVDEESATRIAERATEMGITIPNALWVAISTAFSGLFGGLPSLLLTAIFGEHIWQRLSQEAQEKGVSLPTLMWTKFVETVNLVWQGLLNLLMEAIFGKAIWDVLTKEADKNGKSVGEFVWGGITNFIATIPEKVRTLFTEKFINPLRNMFGQFFGTGESAGKSVGEGMRSGGSDTNAIGQWISDNFVRGLSNYGGIFNVFSNIRNAIYNNLGTMGQNAWNWGRNLVESFKNGMEAGRYAVQSAVSWISSAISNLWRSHSPPREGVLKDIDQWGQNLTRTFADNMAIATPDVVRAVTGINQAIEKGLGDIPLDNLEVSPTITGGIGTNITANADQASVVGVEREARLDEQAEAGRVVVEKNYNIQPGQMIATRGEIRNFIRMLQEYEAMEDQR